MTRVLAVCLLCLGVLGAGGAAGALDGTPPVITFEVVGTPGANGWYVSATTVRWRFEDPESGIKLSTGCDATTLVADTTGTRVTCSATNMVDVASTASLTIKIDRSAPAVTGATPDRPFDSPGWYTRAVRFTFTGTDATSGIASCTAVTYEGPDSGEASVSGTCADLAGNMSAPAAASFRFDGTAPALRGVTAQPGDGEVLVRWTPLAQWEWVEVRRSVAGRAAAPRVVYRGAGSRFVDRHVRNGVDYRYAVTGRDEAGHATEAKVAATPLGPLRAPTPGARVSSPPTLKWKRAHGAVLYNVQLFRGTHKLLSAWPKSPRMRLARSWRYAGRLRRLGSGTYRWYVWPGFRRHGAVRFGKLIGSSTFVVTG